MGRHSPKPLWLTWVQVCRWIRQGGLRGFEEARLDYGSGIYPWNFNIGSSKRGSINNKKLPRTFHSWKSGNASIQFENIRVNERWTIYSIPSQWKTDVCSLLLVPRILQKLVLMIN